MPEFYSVLLAFSFLVKLQILCQFCWLCNTLTYELPTLSRLFCKAQTIFVMQTSLCFIQKHKVVQCTDEYSLMRAQAATLRLVLLIQMQQNYTLKC
jgi:hypothetical protein